MQKRLFVTLIFVGTVLVGCQPPSSDQVQAHQQEQMVQESNAQVGMPGVTNFTEKKMVKMLYELRDQKISTYTYVPDMQGRLWHLCDSVGFGLPYGVQYSNPEKHRYDAGGAYNIPQAEPNGLFMPPTAEGTWVMCVAPGGKIDPIYVESRTVVSTRRLKSAGSWSE
jgi:hypothetical protein